MSVEGGRIPNRTGSEEETMHLISEGYGMRLRGNRLHECDRSELEPWVCDCGLLHICCSICDTRMDSCLRGYVALSISSEDYAFMLANIRDAVGEDE